MSVKAQIALRNRKLSVLLRDARLSARLKFTEVAEATGISKGIIKSFEDGRRSPSLPELEILSYYYRLPMQHFWSKEAVSDNAAPTQNMNLPMFINLRQRVIGAMLRQGRETASISLRALTEQVGISTARLKAYELGERPIPVPELEAMISILGGQVEAFFDQTGTIGRWMMQQQATQDFLELPPDVQDFVCKPVNLPYLQLAFKLSTMSAEKLRAVAEGLLDITL
ncbi:MAG: helix-turn-helix transcriptional regulator [Chloroflexota bacterium]